MILQKKQRGNQNPLSSKRSQKDYEISLSAAFNETGSGRRHQKNLRRGQHVLSGTSTPKLNVLLKLRTRVQKALDEKTALPVFNNLMAIITSKDVLTVASTKMKRYFRALTPGAQNQIADEFSPTRLSILQHHLKKGTYKFPEVRRISKPGKRPKKGKKKENGFHSSKPLTLSRSDFDSKVAQTAINLVLLNIYEPLFEAYGVSFGFRPNQNCQKAIIQIPNKTQGMQMALEGAIKNPFTTLNPEKLIKILERRISDQKCLKLIFQCCKAGIFHELQNTSPSSFLGVSQRGIVSPTLWNIYMHEFDRFVFNDVAETLALINKRQNRNAFGIGIQTFKKARFSPLCGSGRKSFPFPFPKSELRMYYMRYAEDWILFHNGQFALSTLIRNKCASFLRDSLHLTLALEKTKRTTLTKTPALFLSFSIKVKSNRSQRIICPQTGALKRMNGLKTILGIDTARLLKGLTSKGFLDSKKRPREQPAWSTQSDYEIIKRYNALIRDIIDYYAPLLCSRTSLNYFVYIYKYSCYKTLCQKHRTTISKLITKYGNPLTLPVNLNGKPKTISLLTTEQHALSLANTIRPY